MAGTPNPIAEPVANGAAPIVAPIAAPAPITQPVGNEPWFKGIEDSELRGWTELKGWKSPADAAKSARELETKIGVPAEQLLKLPKDLASAKPEELNAIYDRLGRPATPEDYHLEVPLGDDGAFAKSIAPVLHKHGITAAQAKGLNADWNSMMEEMSRQSTEQVTQKQAAELTDLKREWSGKTFDERSELGRRALREYGAALGKDQAEIGQTLTALEGSIGTAKLLKLFAAIGEKQGEHGFIDSDRGSQTFGMTPEAAAVKKQQLMADPDFTKKYMAGRETAEFQQIDQLNKIILGNA